MPVGGGVRRRGSSPRPPTGGFRPGHGVAAAEEHKSGEAAVVGGQGEAVSDEHEETTSNAADDEHAPREAASTAKHALEEAASTVEHAAGRLSPKSTWRAAREEEKFIA